MGAGFSGAGATAAGIDSIVQSYRQLTQVPKAVRYNPTTKGFVQLESGDMDSMHPVDQAVLYAVTIRKGSVKSSPDTGIDLAPLADANDDNAQAHVDEVVELALAALIANGSVTLVGSPIDSFFDGRITFFVDYVNNLLPGAPARRIGV